MHQKGYIPKFFIAISKQLIVNKILINLIMDRSP